jgi:hypothetical protein
MSGSETARAFLRLVDGHRTRHSLQPFPIPVVANLRVADATKDMAFYLRTFVRLLSGRMDRGVWRPGRSGVTSCLTELGDISVSIQCITGLSSHRVSDRAIARPTAAHSAPTQSRNTATASA